MVIAVKSETNHADNQTVSVIEEFRTVYADAVAPCDTEAAWIEASAKRQLNWQAKYRITLNDAARCYAAIKEGYNAYQPNMIADLQKAFPDCGIEVTPAREYSVAIYLHVPDKDGLRQRVEKFIHDKFKADSISWQRDGALRVWWD